MKNILRNFVGAAGLALSLLATLALSVPLAYAQTLSSTSARQPSPRYFPEQVVHVIRTTLTFNGLCTQLTSASSSLNNACITKIANAALPVNSVVLRVSIATAIAFNSTSSDVITLGITGNSTNLSTATEIIGAGGCTLQTAGVTTCTLNANAYSYLNASQNAASGAQGGFDLFVKWTSGTRNTATAGLAALIIEYVAPNDGLCAPVALGAAAASAAGC